MLLKNWLQKQDIDYRLAGKIFGCSRQTVYYSAIGRSRPVPALTTRIERETGGKVTANDHQLAYEMAHGEEIERTKQSEGAGT